MFRNIQKYILKCAVIVAVKKPAPSRIPLTSEAAQKNNFFTVQIRTLDGEFIDLQIDSVSSGNFTGRLMAPNENGIKIYSTPASIPMNALGILEFKVFHHYKSYRFDYKSPLGFIISNTFKLYYGKIFIENIRQLFFNITTKERTERIEILKKLVDMREEKWSERILVFNNDMHMSAFQLFKDFYGDRVFNNPQYKRMLFRFELILRSFLDSGEISEKELCFQVEPKALALISKYQEENRRHKEQMSHNRWILILTVVVTISAAIQAYTAFWPDNGSSGGETFPKQQSTTP